MEQIVRYIILFFFCIMLQVAYSQKNVPLQKDYTQAVDQLFIENNSVQPTFVKPYQLDSYKNEIIDSVLLFSKSKPKSKKNLFVRKWSYEPLFVVDSTDYTLNIDPLFDFSYGQDYIRNTHYYSNSRGIQLSGHIQNSIFFESSFLETQASFPVYISDYIHSSNAAPGQGQARRFESGAFDYSLSGGSLGFKINRYLNVSLGHGKFFAGDGYRSVLLSDNAFNYPFLRATFNFKNFQYTRVWAILMGDSISTSSFGVREKRLAGFNIFTFIPNSTIQLSFFEGRVFNYPNETQNLDMNYQFFNPILYSNSLFKNDNQTTILGTGIKLSLFKSLQFYAQIGYNSNSIKESFKKRSAFQAGFKYFNCIGIKNLFVHAEYNKAGKYIYSNTIAGISYSHYNQSIAHPFGASFQEILILANYRYKSWKAELNWQSANYGEGIIAIAAKKNKYVKEMQYSTPFIGLGPEVELNSWGGNISYLLNSFSNRRIECGYQSRISHFMNTSSENGYYYIAFKTAIYNSYNDF